MSTKPFGIIQSCTNTSQQGPYNPAGVAGGLRLEGVEVAYRPEKGGGNVRIIVGLTKEKG